MTSRVDGFVKRLPDSEGWWARRDCGRVRWFHVLMVDRDDGTAGALCAWVDDMNDLVTVEQLTKPASRWCGPIALPPGWT